MLTASNRFLPRIGQYNVWCSEEARKFNEPEHLSIKLIIRGLKNRVRNKDVAVAIAGDVVEESCFSSQKHEQSSLIGAGVGASFCPSG
ncbi:hypothetical protein Tco_0195955 [Tanacetum coccineum]